MNTPEAVDILLVEDNPRDAELTIRALKKRNLANNLYTVEDGAAALDFLFGQGAFVGRYQSLLRVILLDLKLPKVGGLEVLQAIKSNERTRTIPVVILTSSRQDPDIKAAYDLGANSYIVKPVDFEGFSEAMSHIGLYWLLINQI
jgi:two-component system, response regulator